MMGAGASRSTQGMNFNGFDFGGQPQSSGSRRARRPQTPKEDLDITKTLNITAKDVFNQKPIGVNFSEMERCTQCPPGADIVRLAAGQGLIM